ncbi:two-component system sensor histidine kinase SenX3 [Aurantimicrobium minutum]|uniref:sensor histidine kinase n=1 Tax=Aurantimicrobium minutum TaxID=708131 RepID=UPI002404E016|nr:ATP-binding protein [Aurantimicrobium minutum]MDF9809511.1 two-component system sensor histidine kinase SenX3 [Aurantimicrobium minutum]
MSASVVLLALGVGAVAGVAVVLLIIWVLRQRRMDNEKTSGDLPRGVAQLVSKLDGAVLVLDKSLNVLIASDATSRLSLSGNGRLLIPELVLIAEQAAQGKSVSREDFEISRGPLGDATLTVTVHASPFRNRFVLLSVIDRGEYQRLDDVRREFVANVSHELKTPIASVGLLAEALVEAADEPDTVRHFAERLTKESQRLGAITREIIELSRLQAEGALAEFAPVTVETVVMNAVEQNRVVAKSRKIKLVTGGDLDAVVYGDAESLTVALNNLIANAVHYSPDNSQVGIGAVRRNSFIEIAVTDQGIGMTKDESERVFERFYRTDQARSRSTGGSGLGLSIVKHIVSNHGGDIRVWSSPGKGSTFTIRIPEAITTGKDTSA